MENTVNTKCICNRLPVLYWSTVLLQTPPYLAFVLPRFSHRLASPSCLITNAFIMYLYHLISIDLQLSRLCNSLYYKAYSYEPGSH